MHLASEVDDLLTRPSASTRKAAAGRHRVKPERRRSLAPHRAHSSTCKHVHIINTLSYEKISKSLRYLQHAVKGERAEDKETSLSASKLT